MSTALTTPVESRSCPFEEDVEVRRRGADLRDLLVPTPESRTNFQSTYPLAFPSRHRDPALPTWLSRRRDHIAAQLTCLLYCYGKRKHEVDDGKNKKDASYYLVLTHFVGRGLDDVAGYWSK